MGSQNLLQPNFQTSGYTAGTHVPGYSARLSANLAQALGLSVTDLAPGSRTGRFFSYAALAIVMSILACAGVRYPTLEWRRCRL